MKRNARKSITEIKESMTYLSYVCPKCFELQDVNIKKIAAKIVFKLSDDKPGVKTSTDINPVVFGRLIKVYHNCKENAETNEPMIPYICTFASAISTFNKNGFPTKDCSDGIDAGGNPYIVFNINKHQDDAEICFNKLTDAIEKSINMHLSGYEELSAYTECYFDSETDFLTLAVNTPYTNDFTVGRVLSVFDRIADVFDPDENDLEDDEDNDEYDVPLSNDIDL